MLFFDLLFDFLEARGLSAKFICNYYNLMLPVFGRKSKFIKMAAVLIGLQDIWLEVFKIMNVFYEE